MKLLLDMNIPPHWAVELRSAGHDAVHWRDIGKVTAGDAELMAHARLHGLVVLTHDLDFGDILAATGGDAPSVVQLRTDGLRFDAIGARVLRALADHADALDLGALVTVDLRRLRVRLLPLDRR
jgi:predicted nuclease of predicted toxin-antitoxin system